jgi:hypothetical protein
MIDIKLEEVVGWDHAIRGMRNPKNSWDRSDSTAYSQAVHDGYFDIGPNDRKLMTGLASGGPVHAKYRRMIVVYLDITAPLYWWKEFDTYKVGTVANSCSTMHKIHAKEFTLEDFSCEHLISSCINPNGEEFFESSEHMGVWTSEDVIELIIEALNYYRRMFLETKDKKYWWQMIQLLPSSYNQKRTIMLNYEVLTGMYRDRKNHKLDEWREFCEWIETLPYSEIITGGRKDGE